jgi:trans-2,3-dihydro-3-hydroxyanthranilate isomerase
MPGFRYVVVDVFTDRPLAGNQLAVFTEPGAVPEELYQPLARELNFSETAFVVSPQEKGDFGIRIFTPGRELQFAGHPILGTAVALAMAQRSDEIRLETGAGTVPVLLAWRGAEVAFGRMDQPLPSVEPYPAETELLTALGVERSELPVEIYDNGVQHVYVCLGSAEAVAALQPDTHRLSSLPLALGFSCFAGAGRSWKTRMFGPAAVVPEDPATGSAAGPLAVHLARHGRIGFGEEIEISQGAEIGRPATLFARAEGSRERIERVTVGGDAVIVARGEFALATSTTAESDVADLALSQSLQRTRERLISAREEERRRLRRDLHDGLGPALTAAALKIDLIDTLLPGNSGRPQELLRELRTEVGAAIDDIRRLVYELRPAALDQLGLIGALREQAAHFAATEAGEHLAISVEGPDELPPLPAAVEVAAYRIAAEAITNAARHSGALHCRVRIAVARDLELEIIDDGRWQPGADGGTGLASMRERAAELGGQCLAGPTDRGGGRVYARIPLAVGQ